ncbi:hypothetical protein Neosp_002924 [[Neocosmospora] mangrovei]
MYPSMESNYAIGNESHGNSFQHNGTARQNQAVSVYVASSGATPVQNPPSTSSSVKDKFDFGSIQALEEDQDSHGESKPIPRLTPTINKADAKYIKRMGTRIEQKYKALLDRTGQTANISPRFEKLIKRATDQKMRINIQVESIKKWRRLPGNSRYQSASALVSQDTMPEYGMSQRSAELRERLREIHQKLNKAVSEISQISERSQSRTGTGRTRSSRVSKNSKVSPSSKSPSRSEVLKNLGELVEQIEIDIAAIQSQLIQLSTCHPPFQSTKAFGELFVSSSATRTLYRHLCQACPLNEQEQGHSHTALVGLVPGREPRDIVRNKVAITTHHVAIESTFCQGHYIWFEARSTLILPGDANEAVCSEPSSPQAVIEGLQQRFRRDSNSSTTPSLSTELSQASQARRGSDDFCRIQVCPGSLAQGSNRLAMCIGDDQESGHHRMFYLGENRRPKTSCDRLNLSDIIQDGEESIGRHRPRLFERSHKLKEDRFKLAFKIAEAALRYGWREFGDAWGIENIEFYPYESKRMPFLRAMIKHSGSKLEDFMLNLGTVLLQLGLWEVHTLGRSFDRFMEHHLVCLGAKTDPEFQEAVRYCVGFARYGDRHGDDNDFQHAFYQNVISPLRKLAKMPINDKSDTSGTSGHSTDTEMSS